MKNKKFMETAVTLMTIAMAVGVITAVTPGEKTKAAETEEAGVAVEAQAKQLELTDRFAQQKSVDEALLQEAKNGYSLDEALIVVNPYGTSPLSAVAVFSTEEACGGTITVKGKSSENDVAGTFDSEKNHIVPIYGLYRGCDHIG